MEKKMRRVYNRIKSARGLSEEEKLLFARSLSRNPDERWAAHENFLKSHGLSGRSARRVFGSK